MVSVIGLVAQGAMGAGIGGRLAQHGFKVLTVLEGRSAASAKRAEAAGMTPASWREIAEADMFLSVLPPSEALAMANTMAPYLKASKRKPVYADLNAISPNTAVAIAGVIEQAGCVFADGGICGLPPAANGSSPVIYASGPGARAFGELKQHGLDIRVMDAPVGAASAVKVCYAGITKGFTAMSSVMILAATRFGAGDTLRDELMDSRPELFDALRASVPRMFDKAYRFAGEMEEIADFVATESGGAQIYDGFAEVYRTLAEDRRGPNRDTALLERFFADAAQRKTA